MARRTPKLSITTPCPLSWADLSGDGPRRYCAQCDRHVHDLSALTRRQIRTLMTNSKGQVCGMIRRDAAGRMLTAPPWWRRLGSRVAAFSVLLQPGSCEPPDEPVVVTIPAETETLVTPDGAEAEEIDLELMEREFLEQLSTLGYIEIDRL